MLPRVPARFHQVTCSYKDVGPPPIRQRAYIQHRPGFVPDSRTGRILSDAGACNPPTVARAQDEAKRRGRDSNPRTWTLQAPALGPLRHPADGSLWYCLCSSDNHLEPDTVQLGTIYAQNERMDTRPFEREPVEVDGQDDDRLIA